MRKFIAILAFATLPALLVGCEEAQQGSFTDSRDGKKYKTVKIGSQVWMAENLNYEANGSKCYENNSSNCQKYGRLYNWHIALNSCPSGWHLPSNDEWDELYRFADGTSGTESHYESKTAGKLLKATNGWDNDSSGTDEFGFAALPGGYGRPGGYFNLAGIFANWWSASESSDIYAYYRTILKYDDDGAYLDDNEKDLLFNVRCVRDYNENGKVKDAKHNKDDVAGGGKRDVRRGSFTDSRDGKTYKTVKIGSQNWMAENLDYNATGSKCYDNMQANCKQYGRLYNWETAKKACPAGWHLPSNEEWEELYLVDGTNGSETPSGSLYGNNTEGKLLKATSGWNSYKDVSGNGTDDYGFSALPGGYKHWKDGSFRNVGYIGYWWSSSKDGNGAYRHQMEYDRDYANHAYDISLYLFSVRCVQGSYENGKVKDVERNKNGVADVQRNSDPKDGKVKGGVLKDGVLTDSRDGKKYKAVKIGNKTWMAENLNYNASGSKCYGNQSSNCQKYGRLYNWNTALKACPSGWYLPSKSEWHALDQAILTGNGNGTDESVFALPPGGNGYSDGSFDNAGYGGRWWSSSEYYGDNAHYRFYDNGYINWSFQTKSNFLISVRCVKN